MNKDNESQNDSITECGGSLIVPTQESFQIPNSIVTQELF